jgi:hypothetical protein
MNRSTLLCRYWLPAGAALLSSFCAFGAEPASAPPHRAPAAQAGTFDWAEHTQQTLDELRKKLNLTPAQSAAWESWSAGVMKDAHQQLERKMDDGKGPPGMNRSWADGPTPERMAHGIERLRATIVAMQEHLSQLEAAQARTKTFYDQLDANQKTIFDLFWHEVHHRVGGFEGFRMHPYMGCGPGAMPGGAYPSDGCGE